MSLDVWLKGERLIAADNGPVILIREDGQNKTVSREEWDRRFPGQEPVTFTSADSDSLYDGNITHNLGKMAEAAGIYKCLWRPDEIGITTAGQLIGPLAAGLARLRSDRVYFEQFNAANGWGKYDGFVRFVEEYLLACRAYPSATVHVWRYVHVWR